MNASATGLSAQNSFSAAVLGRTARRGEAGRSAVVLVADRRLAGRDQEVLGDDLPGAGHDDQQPPVVGPQPHLGADQSDGHRVAG